MSDAAVEVAKLLGKSLPMLIVGGGFGWALLQWRTIEEQSDERVEKAQQEARQHLQAEIDAANTAMREAYKLSADLHTQMLGNARSVVDVQSQASTTTKTLFDDVLALKQKVVDETRKLDDAKEEAERSLASARDALGQLERARTDMKALQLERATATADLETARRELAELQSESSAKASKRADDIRALRERLTLLVEHILDRQFDPASDTTQLVALAKETNAEFLVDPAELLRDFAAAEDHAFGALEPLIGLDVERLDALLRQPLGFQAWVRLESTAYTTFAGCVRQQGHTVETVIDLTCFDGRVAIANWADTLRILRVRDAENWSIDEDWSLVEHRDGETVASNVIAFGSATWPWSVGTWSAARDAHESSSYDRTVIHGQVDDFDVMDAVRLRAMPAPYVERVLANPAVRDSVVMEERAARLDAVLQELPRQRIGDEALSAALDGLIRAAVRGDVSAAQPLVRSGATTELLGTIAAVALHPTCKWLDVAVSNNAAQAAQKMAAPGPAFRMTISAENHVHEKPPRVAVFTFQKQQADSPWLLESLDFSLAPAWQPPAAGIK